jgi:hypothetical protein
MRERLAALEPWVVSLIAAHTVGVGLMLLLAPVWSCTVFGGWPALGPLFFPRQSGIFHFVLAFAYLYEYFRHRGVVIMVSAKAFAVVFLLGCTILDGVPWVVPFSAVTDGLMGLTVIAVRRLTGRVER